MKKLLLRLIHGYQKSKFFHRPIFRFFYLSDKNCRFIPTCSEYCFQAIEKYGIIKGVLLGLKRVLKCHPWNRGGSDPLK